MTRETLVNELLEMARIAAGEHEVESLTRSGYAKLARTLRAAASEIKKQESMRSALSAASRDIHDWVRLAKRQRNELPDCDRLPCGPTANGIAASERVLAQIDAALEMKDMKPSPSTPLPQRIDRAAEQADRLVSAFRELQAEEAKPSPSTLPPEMCGHQHDEACDKCTPAKGAPSASVTPANRRHECENCPPPEAPSEARIAHLEDVVRDVFPDAYPRAAQPAPSDPLAAIRGPLAHLKTMVYEDTDTWTIADVRRAFKRVEDAVASVPVSQPSPLAPSVDAALKVLTDLFATEPERSKSLLQQLILMLPGEQPSPLAASLRGLRDRMQQIRERAERASAGPWQQTFNGAFGVKLWDAERHSIFVSAGGLQHSRISESDPVPQWQKDCDFVREARQDIPWLLDKLDALLASVPQQDYDDCEVMKLAESLGLPRTASWPEIGGAIEDLKARSLPSPQTPQTEGSR
jgi:hypothetical protein